MIAGPQHLIAERTRRFGMGWCLDEISTENVAELLGRINHEEMENVTQHAKFKEFLAEHSPEGLARTLDEVAGLLGK